MMSDPLAPTTGLHTSQPLHFIPDFTGAVGLELLGELGLQPGQQVTLPSPNILTTP